MDYEKVYREIHEKKPKHWAGTTVLRHVDKIAELVGFYQPERLLDYASGKGYQYLKHRIHERWGGLLPYCYDIGVRQICEKPEGPFDGVICTDMLEHIEEQDVPAIIADIFSFIPVTPERTRFAFLSISCRPCKDIILPDGRNGHLTQKPPKWWDAQLEPYVNTTGLAVKVVYDVAHSV